MQIRSSMSHAAFERTWHIQDSQGQILASAFSGKSLNPFKLFHLRSDAVVADCPVQGYLAHKKVPPS